MTNERVWSIDLGMYSVQTRDDVPQKMKYGRDFAGFITVNDLNGRTVFVNMNNVLSIKESEGDVLNLTDQVIKSTLASFGFGVSTPKKEETIQITDDEVEE